MADQKQVEMLLRGVEEWNAWRSRNELVRVHLHRADLSGADLTGANLCQANAVYAKFRETNLRSAILENADLSNADLSNADLSGANLFSADLDFALLDGANFTRVELGYTQLSRLDASPIVQAAGLKFQGPARVDWSTIARSLKSPNLHDFLVRCGTPVVFATYMIDCAKSMSETDLFSLMQSTFISYGGPDEEFARKLQEALNRNGVRTWFFPQDAEPGQKLHRTMARGIENHDRVIVICSKASLGREGVSNEIEQSLEKEAELGGEELIIPVRIDSYLFDGWKPANPEHGKALRRRVVADFRDEAEFNTSLGKLLKALKREPDGGG